MKDIQEILHYVSGPLIGSVIGYFTNYLAVKMLFHPRNEIRICGKKLPFTPGAIPKGKPRLAKAIGNVVGETLLTRQDIREQLLNEEMEEMFVSAVIKYMNGEVKEGILDVTSLSEEHYEQMRKKLIEEVDAQILDSLERIKVGEIIAKEGKQIIKNKVTGTMLAMFLSDEMLDSLIGPIGNELERFMVENGAAYLEPEMELKIKEIESSSIIVMLQKMGIEEEQIKEAVKKVYHQLVLGAVDQFLEHFNISALIEEKINAMDIIELENLVLTVMKKELDMIVNLGAVIGLLLGILNIFI